ncbi:MAG: redoxin domain-containing protein [Gemmatimonadota bacterium]
MSSELPALGSTSPHFSAKSSDGSTVNLTELLQNGSVALFFYPGDDTPGCNRQLSAVRDDLADFRAAGIQPFGVNPAGMESHAKYARKFDFNFPLLVDADRAIAGAFGALKENGTSIQRSVLGVGRDGTICFAVRGAPPPAEVIAAFEK